MGVTVSDAMSSFLLRSHMDAGVPGLKVHATLMFGYVARAHVGEASIPGIELTGKRDGCSTSELCCSSQPLPLWRWKQV